MIVDDEAPARKRLRRLLASAEDAGRLEIVAEASNGPETLKLLEADPVDVLFLDIRMPELDGFDTLERIHPDHRPLVIFTTAYDEYAIRAFEANAIDYLLKPISEERIEEAIRRAEKVRLTPDSLSARNERLSKLLDWLDEQAVTGTPTPTSASTSLKQISIPYRDKILIVPVDRLLSAEISEGITRLYVFDEDPIDGASHVRPHIVSYTLDQLESNLDPEMFMRVHRAAIVQIGAIQEMIQWFSGRFKLVLTGGHEVIASRERSRHLKERMMI